MAGASRDCPQCGRPLTQAPGDPARLACEPCGKSFSVRPKNAAVAASVSASAPAPTNDFADLTTPVAPRPKSGRAAWLRSGSNSNLRMVLVLGGSLAFALVLLLGGVGLAVAFWPRAAAKPAQFAVAPVDPPTTPPDRVFTPAPIQAPPADDPKPQSPPNKPAPPKDEPPPVQADPGPRPPPLADPPPTSPDPKPPAGPIGQAIDKAVAYLKKEATNGPPGGKARVAGVAEPGRVGTMGLIGLALLESGVPPDDPAVAAAVSAARDGAGTCGYTYEIAITIWFLDRLGDPADEDLIRRLAVQLIAGQLEFGLWHYACPDLAPDPQKELLETLDKYEPSAAIPAEKVRWPACDYYRGKTLEKGWPGGGGDLSLTQFAVLGLWVARKHHVPVDRSLLLAEACVRGMQAADGGWAYSITNTDTTDSMTCSGLLELAVGRAVSQPRDGKTDAADPHFEKGLEYLADLFTRGVAPKSPATPGQAKNLGAATARLRPLEAGLADAAAQPALWRKGLKDFQAELERCVALDLPADAKADLQEVDDQVRKYEAAPAEQKKKEKTALEKVLHESWVVHGFSVKGGQFLRAGRFLKAGKFTRVNQDDIYCLWSLERLCMVCDLKTVAGHDWYAWGANLLVAYQNDDGSWPNAGHCGQQVDTCLAVLFLKRANVAKDLTAQLQLIAPIKDLPPEKLKYVSPGDTPSPGLTPPSPGEPPPPSPPDPAETPKP